MYASAELRFVLRKARGPDGRAVHISHILQQKWIRESDIEPGPAFEWRDVPLLVEEPAHV